MRVVIAHPHDPSSPTEGGSLRYAFELSRHLTERGVYVTLLGAKTGKKLSGDVKLHFVSVANVWDHWCIYLLKLAFKIPFMQIPRSAVIHTCRLDFMLPFVVLYPGNPKVVTSDEPLHDTRLKHYRFFSLIEFIYHITEMWSLKWKIDRLITDCRTAKEYYEQRYPWVKAKLKVISTSGVDPSKFRPMDKMQMKEKFGFSKNKVVMFVGRLAKVKNIDFLIRSFALVKRQIPNAKLVIVGRGECQLELKQLVRKLNLDDDVAFAGEIHPYKVPEILNCAEVFALCSITEGSPTVVREALACGVPVVSTNVGDINQVVKNRIIGSIVDKDEIKFADALIRFLNLNESERRKVEEECVEASKEFSLEEVFEKVLTLYKSILNARAKIRNSDEL